MLYSINIKKEYLNMYSFIVFCFALRTHIVVLPLHFLGSRRSSVGSLCCQHSSQTEERPFTIYCAGHCQ